ncbi:hypothetical protein HU200_020692 [Digitaria exilis]|uniref:BHLH domain-containing protein n=1 Tax=Digitaria exilis TaxID=1010633 RepID=A0A835F0V1_9POAL|nr:hypothetical protein HU200_020692 [Digitaria exilis]
MDELNQWHSSHPDLEDELAYMCQEQEQQAGMQHTHFAKRLPQQQQLCYTSAPAVVAQPRPPPHHSSSTSFPGLGVPLLPSSLPSLGPPVMEAVKNEPGQPSSSRRILSFGGRPPTPSTAINNYLSGAAAAMQQQAPERRSRAHWNTQEHVVAERKRREKMQQQFTTLATIVPDLTKTDKISLLGSTIKYVKQLEEKVKTLKGQSARRTSEPTTIFNSKCRISTDSSDASGSRTGGFGPTVEARICGDTVLLNICCEDRRGMLVKLISELDNQGLSIINTSVLPFTDSCLNITITAKIGEAFSTTVELVKNLTTALRGFSTRDEEEN